MNLPLFSRIRSGKRWFWCVASESLEDPQFTGFSDTPEAAFEDAKKVAGEIEQIGNWKARVALRQRRAERIQQKESNTQDAHQLEFVYDCWGVDSHHKHRIVKKTKKQIVVEKIPFHWTKKRDGTWRDFDVETFVLPREEFEREGKYLHRRIDWYLTPEVYRREIQESTVPDCFKRLGLTRVATRKDIQHAFRKLALRQHPDVGGDPEEFKRLHEHYEDALARVQV